MDTQGFFLCVHYRSFYARVLSKGLPAQTLFTFFELCKQGAVLFELFALLGHDLFRCAGDKRFV